MKTFLYVVFSSICLGMALEGGVRVLKIAPSLETQYTYFVNDPVLPYRPRPNAVFVGRSVNDEFDFEYRHNRLGYRDVDHDFPKPQNVFRILGLGDSFTYGAGAPFEETYLRRLEQRFNETPGLPKVEIIKAGVPRYFPKPERLLLQHEGLHFQPDLVLVGFVANDVMDTYMGLDAVVVDPSGNLKSKVAADIGVVGNALYRHSHVARIVLRRLTDSIAARQYVVDWAQIFQDSGRYEDAWEEIEREYGRILEIVQATAAHLVLINIPFSQRTYEYYGITDRDYPARRLSAWSKKNGVQFIDVSPAMAQFDESLFWEKDPHCTPAGYRVIADTIFDHLTKTNAVPGRGLARDN
jgi:hypothetical protein